MTCGMWKYRAGRMTLQRGDFRLPTAFCILGANRSLKHNQHKILNCSEGQGKESRYEGHQYVRSITSGFALRNTDVASQSWFFGRGCSHARAGYRGEHGHI